MKTLKQHNEEQKKLYEMPQSEPPCLNGIECPACGKELWDRTPDMSLTCFYPPQKEIYCPACGYWGYAIVSKEGNEIQ